jgi:hypothetical protein
VVAALCALLLVIPGPAAATAHRPAGSASDPSATARNQLIGLLENVTAANASAYQVRDSTGLTVDAIKVIQSPDTGYLGVYHVNLGGKFDVRLGTSTDLFHWRYALTLEPNASMPTIAAMSDGSLLVAYEKAEGTGASHLQFRQYPTLRALSLGLSIRKFDAPRTFSSIAEGTPSVRSASVNGLAGSSTIKVGFHYLDTSLGVDRNARGVLTNFSGWSASIATDINGAFNPPPGGNIGDRDHLTFLGYPFTLIEAQSVKNDWGSWRVYLYDETARTMTPLSINSAGGSVSFANPTSTVIRDPTGKRALVATMFIHSAGSAPGEAGPLIYYATY